MKRYPEYKSSGVPWLGDIPAHWKLSGLKFQLDRNDGGAWGDDPDGDGDTVVLRSTEQTVDGRWKIEDPAMRKLTKSEAEATLLMEGDLLITKSSGSDTHIGKASLVDKDVADLRAGYSNFMQRLRVAADIFPKYVWHLLNSDTTKTQINILASTTTGLANLNAGVLGRLVLAYPPLPEQKAVAAYLDTETARIDTLVQEKEDLIGLLKEWRQSVIAQAVTKGLNKDAPMKVSGVGWLGDIPAHWEVKRLKHFVRFLGGGTPSKENPEYWGSDYPWVSPKDMKRDRISETEDYISTLGLQNSPCALVPCQSLLIVVRSGILQHSIPVALNDVEVTLNQDMKAFLPDERAFSGYIAYYITGRQKDLREEWVKQGATVESIEFQTMADSAFPLPPLPEQKAIAEYLDAETTRIDALIAHTTEEIDLLKELRAATIADAVLGRIDVRETTSA